MRRGYRPQALAWVHYTQGRILYERARGKDGKPDLTKFKDVKAPARVRGNARRARPQQMVKVHEMLGHAYLEVGQDDKGSGSLQHPQEPGHDHSRRAQVPRREDLQHLHRSGAGAGDRDELLVEKKQDATATGTKLRLLRQQALDLGLDYARTIGKPAYALLYNTMRLAEELEDWPKCEKAAEMILKLY
ncbi:MAG: hypothetical protein H6837_13295 [Planctomycetes bacterium]|nr:hypothetical protein [Planctomycetota bacterium]